MICAKAQEFFEALERHGCDASLCYVRCDGDGDVIYHCTSYSTSVIMDDAVQGMRKTKELHEAMRSRSYELSGDESWIYSANAQQYMHVVLTIGGTTAATDKHKEIKSVLRKIGTKMTAAKRECHCGDVLQNLILKIQADFILLPGPDQPGLTKRSTVGIKLYKVSEGRWTVKICTAKSFQTISCAQALSRAKIEGKPGLLTLRTKTGPIILAWNEHGVHGPGPDNEYLTTCGAIRKAYGAAAKAPLFMDSVEVQFPVSQPENVLRSPSRPNPKPPMLRLHALAVLDAGPQAWHAICGSPCGTPCSRPTGGGF